MAITLYEITVPVFIKNLKTLSKCLEKGVAFTKDDGAKISEAGLAESRLIEDMGNLVYQIQRVSDTAKGLAQRIGGVEPVVLEDNEKTFPDLFTRIQKTIEVLEGVKPEHINAQEEAEVVMKTRSGETKWKGKDYALTFAIPNFFFHVVTAYALLRKEGVPVGKADYLGRN
ncbi:uncharacterized protein LY89DRAFT_691946 [Mollisia scopiformis]|uniref:DUF1993 domain-containing protein n=1 Tax=Mollisia scopiformis TaxID=149040 RepID=A0A132B5H7_MOLSC|nr:uncharacterized protein LY89DRAFT_691946 [Mollisia scopiformis]KUJ07144.1 hypothetical protein LY89DRAFT_691946 [Mollisia scopiformis]